MSRDAEISIARRFLALPTALMMLEEVIEALKQRRLEYTRFAAFNENGPIIGNWAKMIWGSMRP
jgi:hypothetical protein